MTCVGLGFAHSGLRILWTSDPGLPPWAILFGPFGAVEAVDGPKGDRPADLCQDQFKS